MASVARQYTRELAQELRFLPAWPPGVRIELGDIGQIDNENIFGRVTSLANLGINPVEMEASGGTETFQYASAGAVQISFKASGQESAALPNVPAGKAGLGISFSRESATAFRADGVEHRRFADQVALRQEVASLIRAGRWDRSWTIVTHVARARSTTALVARSKGAGVEFALSADVGAGGLELLSADVGLQTVSSREMQVTIVGAGGMTPLFLGLRVRRRWFLGRPELRAAFSGEFIELDPASEESDEDLFEGTPIYNGIEAEEDAPAGAGA